MIRAAFLPFFPGGDFMPPVSLGADLVGRTLIGLRAGRVIRAAG